MNSTLILSQICFAIFIAVDAKQQAEWFARGITVKHWLRAIFVGTIMVIMAINQYPPMGKLLHFTTYLIYLGFFRMLLFNLLLNNFRHKLWYYEGSGKGAAVTDTFWQRLHNHWLVLIIKAAIISTSFYFTFFYNFNLINLHQWI